MGPDLTSVTGVTKQVCAQCGESLEFTEEVFLLQIVRAHEVHGQLSLHVALADDGDFLYEPHFIHFKCWEEIQEELEEELEDEPPILAVRGVIDCRACSGGIEPSEVMGALTLGELHLSKRAPTSTGRGEDFEEGGDPFLFCVYCLNLINDNWLEFWKDGISETGECMDCIQSRCWRLRGTIYECPCPCHSEVPSEED